MQSAAILIDAAEHTLSATMPGPAAALTIITDDVMAPACLQLLMTSLIRTSSDG